MITVFSLTSDFKLEINQYEILEELDFSYVCPDHIYVQMSDLSKVVNQNNVHYLAMKDFKIEDMPFVIACFNPIVKDLRDKVIKELDRLNLLWIESFNALRTIQEDYQSLNAET